MMFLGKDQSTGRLIVASALYAKLLTEDSEMRLADGNSRLPYWMQSKTDEQRS